MSDDGIGSPLDMLLSLKYIILSLLNPLEMAAPRPPPRKPEMNPPPPSFTSRRSSILSGSEQNRLAASLPPTDPCHAAHLAKLARKQEELTPESAKRAAAAEHARERYRARVARSIRRARNIQALTGSPGSYKQSMGSPLAVPEDRIQARRERRSLRRAKCAGELDNVEKSELLQPSSNALLRRASQNLDHWPSHVSVASQATSADACKVQKAEIATDAPVSQIDGGTQPSLVYSSPKAPADGKEQASDGEAMANRCAEAFTTHRNDERLTEINKDTSAKKKSKNMRSKTLAQDQLTFTPPATSKSSPSEVAQSKTPLPLHEGSMPTRSRTPPGNKEHREGIIDSVNKPKLQRVKSGACLPDLQSDTATLDFDSSRPEDLAPTISLLNLTKCKTPPCSSRSMPSCSNGNAAKSNRSKTPPIESSRSLPAPPSNSGNAAKLIRSKTPPLEREPANAVKLTRCRTPPMESLRSLPTPPDNGGNAAKLTRSKTPPLDATFKHAQGRGNTPSRLSLDSAVSTSKTHGPRAAAMTLQPKGSQMLQAPLPPCNAGSPRLNVQSTEGAIF
eukprot:gnl/MRDRNA2_/MRDRNA2_119358_c0_seq1.p1 gnl/MRDRNA2_/MRDRNA2_119358_c0~~gnl/MRDRNA2_/MRDRNA2_119358_c0_seq1.p1  ORF type:complete len:605 (+),score=102.23 gnl/MRDRNA2_/MRDRNA2_119358_c0_seq1:127-1815(+)